MLKYSYFLNTCFFLKILLTILTAKNFTFKVGNSKIVENILPE